MAAEVKFSQCAAVMRCRNVTESKLRAKHALAKLADEEVTIYSANLDDARHQLRTQMIDGTSVNERQITAAIDAKISWQRKEQLNSSVEKLTAIKGLLRFQEEARERDVVFKSSIIQKRGAFQGRLARLEVRQTAERNELFLSQNRLAETMTHIRAIEILSIKDKNKARRMKRDNEIQSQQSAMRQQKESEFLRELQLCKARQLGELNDLEISGMEEMEDIVIQQRLEEFDMVSKQMIIEAEMIASLDSQKARLEADQLLEKQKSLRMSLQRSQRKQASSIAKTQRAATRLRERMCVADNPIIRGETANDFSDKELEGESVTDSQSEATSRSGGSTLSLHENNDKEPEEDENKLADLLVKNSNMNKDTKVLSEAEKEMIALVELGNERNRGVVIHHKRLVTELKQQHRAIISQKAKENRRKFQAMLKDHEEEIEQVKVDQAASMQELLDTHLHSEEMRADTAVSQNLLGTMLPAHIIEKIELGQTPQPEQFGCATLFFTDINEFKKIVGQVDAVKILKLLNVMYTRFDEVIAKYPQLYKVETVSDTYMVAAGLGSQTSMSEQEFSECTRQALSCAIELQKLVNSMNFTDILGNIPIKLRIGIHSGALNAGLIGTKMSRYCLFGDTVNTASRMCTTGEAGKVQVSAETIGALGEDDNYEFEERGAIEVKGKGRMTTYWLLL